MSYDIIYNKQFVKLRKTGEVIPMLLSGSNNCYEIGLNGRDGRRSRDWSSMRYYNRKGKLSENPDVILDKLDAEIRKYIRTRREREVKPADIRNHFGYYSSLVVGSGHCGGTSWDMWRGVFSNGIKHALTIEELDALGVNLRFSAYVPGDSPNGKPAPVPIKTEQEYFAELRKWREWQAQAGHTFSLSFFPMSTDRVLERLRSLRRKTPREKTRVEQDHYFVLTDGSSALLKYTSRGYRYSWSISSGKKFRSEKEADAYRERLINKGRYKADIWKVERIDNACAFMV